jgi:hypothetical protein
LRCWINCCDSSYLKAWFFYGFNNMIHDLEVQVFIPSIL